MDKNSKPSLFLIFKEFWDTAPYCERYTPYHSSLFFLLVNFINKNYWNKTEIGYEHLIYSARMNKRTYLKCRGWLFENKFIDFNPGTGNIRPAEFWIHEDFVKRCKSAPHTAPHTAPIIEKTIKTNKTIKTKKGGEQKFSPPALEEIKSYCLERKNSVDSEKFLSHYTSNGWKVGKNKMVDWKAAVHTWEKNGVDKPPPAKESKTNFSQAKDFRTKA